MIAHNSTSVPSATNGSSTDTSLLGTINSNRNMFIYVYASLIGVVLYLVFQRALTLYLFCLRASRRIHEKLLESVIRAKMYFFNTNSSGRIINRFSKDLYDVDFYLATVFYDLLLVSTIQSLFLTMQQIK